VILWAAIALVTLLAAAAVAWPLLRPRAAAAPRASFDRAVYRDQLAELDRDCERGVLDAAQAAAARLEIERRLLAADGAAAAEAPSKPAPPVDGITAAALAAAVSAAAIALYLAIGSPETRDAPFAARQAGGALAARGGAPGDLAASAASLEAKLKDHPEDAAGWLLLARTEAVLQHWQESADAYRRAMALTGDGAEAASGYGEALVMAAGGIVTPAAEDAFRTALRHDPKNPPARFYMALAEAQSGRPEAALAGWAALAADSPPDAPWQSMVRQSAEETARAAGLPMPKLPEPPPAPSAAAAAAEGAPGPTAADIAAAQQMSRQARQQMIRGMVEGLAARLEKNPGDAAGWTRLAKAYRVLGETAKAEAAEERAAAAAQATPSAAPVPAAAASAEVAALLDRAHALLQSSGAAQDVRVPLPQGVVDIMHDIEARAPDEPEALWYLGLAAAQRRDPKAAAQYWSRLLGLLPPGSEHYKTVEAALGALAPAQ